MLVFIGSAPAEIVMPGMIGFGQQKAAGIGYFRTICNEQVIIFDILRQIEVLKSQLKAISLKAPAERAMTGIVQHIGDIDFRMVFYIVNIEQFTVAAFDNRFRKKHQSKVAHSPQAEQHRHCN